MTQITLSLLLTNHFIFEGGGWANAKKISCTAFAEKIEIVHSSTEQRNILQTSEINFMRRSRKLLVTKKYLCQKKMPPPPSPHSKIKWSIPSISLADDYNSCTIFFLRPPGQIFFATKASIFWGALCILNQCGHDRRWA